MSAAEVELRPDVWPVIAQLAAYRAQDVFNPWGEVDPLDVGGMSGPAGRQTRLALHFSCEPEYLLVGEAPGYQGCHFSGVAFTNEALLLERMIPRMPALSARITTRPRPWREPAATVVWRTLHVLGMAERVVLWNAFAWHPHRPGDPYSNRAPRLAELGAGREALEAVLELFPGVRIVAVGKVAERTLRDVGVAPAAAVRHPSMGGARQFADELRALCHESREDPSE